MDGAGMLGGVDEAKVVVSWFGLLEIGSEDGRGEVWESVVEECRLLWGDAIDGGEG
jgi:hypothetical protein